MVEAAFFESRFTPPPPHSSNQVSNKQNVSFSCSLLKIQVCDRQVACSVSNRHGSYFESCVWRA